MNTTCTGVSLQRRRLLILSVAAMLTVTTSCKKDDNNAPTPPGTIVQQISANGNLTILNAILKQSYDSASLGKTPMTLFAPTDAAFQAAGITRSMVASARDSVQRALRDILDYHLVVLPALSSAISLSAITGTAASPQVVQSSSSILFDGGNLFLYKIGGNTYVNGATITQADVPASNGVIHVINKVLIPTFVLGKVGRGDVVSVARADTSLSLLATAAQAAGPALTTALTAAGENGVTVFAPTNAAFRAAGYNATALAAASPATLATILTYHVVPGRLFSPMLTSGQSLTTLQGGTVTVGVNGSAMTLLGKGNGTSAANVVTPDILATNGVIHKINRVLLAQ